MQWKSALLGAAIAATGFLALGRVFAGDDDKPMGAPDPEMMKLTQPGPEHAALAAYEGSWEGKGTYMGSPWTSQFTGKMVMGGRFLQMEEEITAGTTKMHMMSFVGYDNLKKKYVHCGVGDDSTSLMQDEGQRDAAKKVTEMSGVEHRGPGKDAKYRFTVSDVVEGTWHIELYMDEGAGEQKAMVGEYKKK